MFSNKLDYNTEENKLSKLLSDKKKSGVKLLDLTESNPTKAGFDYQKEKILESIAHPDSLLYNPNPKGLLSARTAIKNYYNDFGIDVNVENIFLTSATSEAYSFVFKLLTDPFDEILIPSPGYPLFSFISELESVSVKYYKLKYSASVGFEIDFDSLNSQISDKTKAIVIVNPNNPTGNYLKKNDLTELINICKNKNISLICDEVFLDFNIEKESDEVVSISGVNEVQTFTLSGISKVCGLPQLKLSWIIVNGKKEICEEAKSKLEVIADTYLSVGTPVQLALKELLGNRQYIQSQISERINSNYNFLKSQFLNDNKISLLKTEGGWYSVLKMFGIINEEKSAFDLLDKQDVYIHPGYYFDFEEEGYIIVSLLTQQDVFKEGIIRIVNHLSKENKSS
jgi:alanine-synthesizing transaminase